MFYKFFCLHDDKKNKIISYLISNSLNFPLFLLVLKKYFSNLFSLLVLTHTSYLYCSSQLLVSLIFLLKRNFLLYNIFNTQFYLPTHKIFNLILHPNWSLLLLL